LSAIFIGFEDLKNVLVVDNAWIIGESVWCLGISAGGAKFSCAYLQDRLGTFQPPQPQKKAVTNKIISKRKNKRAFSRAGLSRKWDFTRSTPALYAHQ
jgi:hypothetical protein